MRQQSHDLLLNIGRQIRPLWVALRTSKQRELARSPRDRRYRHRHLLHVASIEAVFSAQARLGPVAVRPAGPLSVRGGTARWRSLAWMPASYSRLPRPTSRAGPPKPDKPGRLPSRKCATACLAAFYQNGMHPHCPAMPWVPGIADFTDISNMGVVLLSCMSRSRLHDSLQKDAPNRRAVEHRPGTDATVISLPRLGGLHHRSLGAKQSSRFSKF